LEDGYSPTKKEGVGKSQFLPVKKFFGQPKTGASKMLPRYGKPSQWYKKLSPKIWPDMFGYRDAQIHLVYPSMDGCIS